MFAAPDHVVPHDGYMHVLTMECGCKPKRISTWMLGTWDFYYEHHHMLPEPVEAPDTIPEWMT